MAELHSGEPGRLGSRSGALELSIRNNKGKKQRTGAKGKTKLYAIERKNSKTNLRTTKTVAEGTCGTAIPGGGGERNTRLSTDEACKGPCLEKELEKRSISNDLNGQGISIMALS